MWWWSRRMVKRESQSTSTNVEQLSVRVSAAVCVIGLWAQTTPAGISGHKFGVKGTTSYVMSWLNWQLASVPTGETLARLTATIGHSSSATPDSAGDCMQPPASSKSSPRLHPSHWRSSSLLSPPLCHDKHLASTDNTPIAPLFPLPFLHARCALNQHTLPLCL